MLLILKLTCFNKKNCGSEYIESLQTLVPYSILASLTPEEISYATWARSAVSSFSQLADPLIYCNKNNNNIGLATQLR